MNKILLLALGIFINVIVYSQENRIQNTQLRLAGDVLYITYDITGNKPLENVWIIVSIPDGEKITPKNLTGDTGHVPAGTNKQMVWDMAAEGYELGGKEISVEITADEPESEPEIIIVDTSNNEIQIETKPTVKNNIIVCGRMARYYSPIIESNVFQSISVIYGRFPSWGNNRLGWYISGNYDKLYTHVYNYVEDNSGKSFSMYYSHFGFNIGTKCKIIYSNSFQLSYYLDIGLYYRQNSGVFTDYDQSPVLNDERHNNFISTIFPANTGFILSIYRVNLLAGVRLYHNDANKFYELGYTNVETLGYYPPKYILGFTLGLGWSF
jgi:hypothetical protein